MVKKVPVACVLIPWGRGFKDMGPAIDALEIAIMERKLVHANIPIMNWSVGNAVATTDPAGNRQMDKEKARFRIHGAVALAMCMGLRARDRGSAHAIDVWALIG
jgi:phage terminase large subunit-like protein